MSRAPASFWAPLFAAALLLPLLSLTSATAHAQRRGRRRARAVQCRSPQRGRPTPAQVDQARQLFMQGMRAYQQGDFNAAQEHLDGAWRIVPSAELAYNLGRIHERRGDAPRAICFYREFMSRAEPSAEERANVEARITELEALAQRQRDQIYTLPPSDDALVQEAQTFFTRGVAMFRRRRWEAAMQAFTAAYQFARLPEVVYNLAVVSERLHRTRDAIDYYREYLRLRRDSPDRAQIEAQIERLRSSR